MIDPTPRAIDALHQLHRLHLPECSARYHRDTLPATEADRIRRSRERIGRHLAWLAIGFVVLAFGSAWL